MRTVVNWDLICKFLAGECSAEEEEKIFRLMREDSSYADAMMSVKSIWSASDFLKNDDRKKTLDLQAELGESLKRIHQSDEMHFKRLSGILNEQYKPSVITSGAVRPVRQVSRRRSKGRMSRIWPYVARLAAVILLALMSGLLMVHMFYIENEELVSSETTDRVIYTRTGQVANVNLTDGSSVKLSAQSKILFSKSHTSGENWDFFMEGLAHFNLISDANKSFVIHTQHAIIRVLGTEFSVKAYPDDDYVQIIVASGKVSVEADRDLGTHGITLLKDEMGILNLKNGEISKRDVDSESYLVWLSGRLKFDDFTLTEVSRELQRWFDVQIIIDDKLLAEKRITAVVDNRSLHDVLTVIGIILDASYVLNDEENTVTLQPS